MDKSFIRLTAFAVGILGKPSLLDTLPLFEQFDNRPETGEAQYAEHDANNLVGNKQRGRATGQS